MTKAPKRAPARGDIERARAKKAAVPQPLPAETVREAVAPDEELALLREFAHFVIGRARVSTNSKDHIEWKGAMTARALSLLPKRCRGHQSLEAQTQYREQVAAFCALILQIQSTMDFKVGSRGWCYILERHGLRKGDFDDAEKLISACRKSGDLPLDLCAEDSSRENWHRASRHRRHRRRS
jgi:hypothetical protein